VDGMQHKMPGIRQQKKLRILEKCAKNDKWLACDDNTIAWLAGEGTIFIRTGFIVNTWFHKAFWQAARSRIFPII
jgi:hypothetical protein